MNVTKHLIAFFLAIFALSWPAIFNGQPFFFPDTTNYIRAADRAIVTIFGNSFKTHWTTERPIREPGELGESQTIWVNDPASGQIMAGRSWRLASR